MVLSRTSFLSTQRGKIRDSYFGLLKRYEPKNVDSRESDDTGARARNITSECTVVWKYGNNHPNKAIKTNVFKGYRSGALTLNGLISFD